MQVDVSTEGLGDLSRALTKKRLDYVKLINTLNAPPRGLSDLLAQSRSFVEKLTHFLEDGSELSDSVKSELIDDNGFPGHVRRLPLEDLYNDVNRVKEELRVSDGYQPYIVSPEAGLRALYQKCIGTLVNPVKDLVDSVHGIVVMAADRALNESCQVSALERGPPVTRFPHFIESILPVTLEGLEELKAEAMDVAVRVVEMEKDFVTSSFFRYLTFRRIIEQEKAQNERDNDLRRRSKRSTEDDEEDDDAASIPETEEGRVQAYEDHGDIVDMGHGLGSSIFWSPICRDQNNGLLPSPGVFIDGDTELSMEKAIVQHAADMKAYTRLACETLVMTIPKVIVHCLVDKAPQKLGPKIEEQILRMPDESREMLLEEDVGIAGHRQRVQETVNEIGKAQDELKESERNMGDRNTIRVDVGIIELAGLGARLKRGDDGSVVFINKPPTSRRTVTPEQRKEQPTGSTAQPPQRPAPPVQRSQTGRTQNGVPSKPVPKRHPPPVAVNVAAPQSTSQGNTSNTAPQRPAQPKQAQPSSWYGFKPFSR